MRSRTIIPEDTENEEEFPIQERVVKINRVAKVVKGGRHLSFSALVVVGDSNGKVGIGYGKADAVPDAVRKGAYEARKNIVDVPLKDGTLPHEIVVKYGAAEVMLKPAPPGTGVIAGGPVRAVMELAGVKDVLTKARGSTNAINCVKATYKAITQLRDPVREAERRTKIAAITVMKPRRPQRKL